MKCKVNPEQNYINGRPGYHRASTATYTTASSRYFYPRCSKILQALGVCSGRSGAWVAAVTVCAQKLF